MVRAQTYLTEDERRGLSALANSTGKKRSELIREAVDRFLDLAGGARREAILRKAAGMWKDRKDLPDLGPMRASWERG